MMHIQSFLKESGDIIRLLDEASIRGVVNTLLSVRKSGRVFTAGCGGGAANAMHCASDFRNLIGIESYCVTDNCAELTARINDGAWKTSYADILSASRFSDRDALFVFSVGGGDLERDISASLAYAAVYCKAIGGTVCGIVGRDGGKVAEIADSAIVIPTVNSERVTPHVEGIQMLLVHLLVSHPELQVKTPKWEQTSAFEAGGRKPLRES